MRSELRRRLSIGAALCLSAWLSACVAARLQPPETLSSLGRSCGLAEGELVQEAEEPRILFLYAVGPSRPQIACVARWSRKHHLHLAYIKAVNWQDQ
ncbi:MAG: hypothetical protein JWP15_1507 [Alphaproteobacteria bacterium]|nr:hypothetical protein [Alphaproteobacteria bacterium]